MLHSQVTRRNASIDTSYDTAVTEIIPFREFDALVECAPPPTAPFSCDIAVLTAPELDDTNDLVDERPWLLQAPECASTAEQLDAIPTSSPPTEGRRSRRAAPSLHRRPSAGAHRRCPDATGAVHTRLVFAGLAAGAITAGANTVASTTAGLTESALVIDTAAASAALSDGSNLQVVPVATNPDSEIHRQELANGAAFAQERAEREARLRRPLFVFPTRGVLTSGFGARWGTLHGGLDIANAVGTPIYSASDGEVIASGPTPGYGMWVKVLASDGTVTLYGHIDTTTVQLGDRVMAGDQIATMGNRGNSTGPHLHFEVHRNGSAKIDPMAWLRERGVDE